MTKSEALRTLRNLLVSLYQSHASIQRIVDDAGVNAGQINFHDSPNDVWHAVLVEAAKDKRIDSIIQIVSEEYHGHAEQLTQAYQAYLAAFDQPAGAQQAKPEDSAGRSKYNIHIGNAQGLVIGDNAQVTQNFGVTHINTGGGTYVSGDVNTGGGDFVGRDTLNQS